MCDFHYEANEYIQDALDDLSDEQFRRRVEKDLKKLENRGSSVERSRRKPTIGYIQPDDDKIHYVKTPPDGDIIFRSFYFFHTNKQFGEHPIYLYGYKKKAYSISKAVQDTVQSRYNAIKERLENE